MYFFRNPKLNELTQSLFFSISFLEQNSTIYFALLGQNLIEIYNTLHSTLN